MKGLVSNRNRNESNGTIGDGLDALAGRDGSGSQTGLNEYRLSRTGCVVVERGGCSAQMAHHLQSTAPMYAAV